MRRVWRSAAVVALLTVTAGCAPATTPQVRAAAEAFQHDVAAHDTAGACGLLSDEARHRLESAAARPCPQALAGLTLTAGPVRTVGVWERAGQAKLDGGALFLAEFGTDWKVTGAGCLYRGADQPYDCAVEA